MTHRVPWTRDELNALIPKIEKDLAEAEASQEEEVRPLGPMTMVEALEFFHRLMDVATTRALTQREAFLHGQLLAVFQHAVQAAMLGKKGRYYVISEDDILGRLTAAPPAQVDPG